MGHDAVEPGSPSWRRFTRRSRLTVCQSNQAVDVHVTAAVPGQQALLLPALGEQRTLDSQNPRRAALGSDFGRLGFSFSDDLKAASPATASALDALEDLIDYRNAIGHGDEVRIAAIEALGQIKATKGSYQSFRHAIDRLAGTMDQVVATKLAAVLESTPPWRGGLTWHRTSNSGPPS